MTADERKYAIQGRPTAGPDRIAVMVDNMAENKAYTAALERRGGDADGRLLEDFRDRFRGYRRDWRDRPHQAVTDGLTGDAFRATAAPPLCLDIEVAAVCDLACPFCYRQHIATPDKIMAPDLAFRLIDEAAELGVPSIKLNWRGEPLLNPQLPDFVAHAKKRGILDTIINTNATELDERMSRRLIDAGLDLMIYSFDGGTRESYERMRPGRFKDNSFDRVYGNIRRFAKIRREMGARFPFTKIQMILTEETFAEQDAFYGLFGDCVDEVTVKQYTERGAGLSDLDESARGALAAALAAEGLPADTPYLRDMDGTLHIATGRRPCEQPYQRLLVTYDGKVGMCCYDWGARHPVGYVDDLSFADPEAEYRTIQQKATAGAKGFELLAGAAMPERFNRPDTKVETLTDIWYGPEIDRVRKAHVEDRAGDVPICRQCPFKETFHWKDVTRD